MTDYEIADLVISHVESTLAFLMAFVSLTSAFLVAAFFGKEKLSGLLIRLVAGLYSLGSFFLIFVTMRIGDINLGLRSLMGESMSWHAAYSEPEMVMPIINGFLVLAMLAAYFSSMWYLLRPDNGGDT
jgi:hypothetical protein